MKQFSRFCIALSLFSLVGCYKTVEKMGNTENNVVLSYPAVNQYNIASTGINYWKKSLIKPNLTKATDTLVFSLNMRKALSNVVKVTLGVNEQAVDTFNKDTLYGPTQYTLMPTSYYTIVTPEMTIPSGVTDTTFKVAIKPSSFDISQTGYILPISITKADGIAVSSMNTTLIHIEKKP